MKKLITGLLSFILILGQASSALALQSDTEKNLKNNVTENFKENKITKEELKKHLEEKGVEVLYIKEKKDNSIETKEKKRNIEKDDTQTIIAKSVFKDYDKRTPLKLESVDELDIVINSLTSDDSSENKETSKKNKTTLDEKITLKAEEIKNGNGTASKWSGLGIGGLFAFKNISFAFKYKYYPLAGCYIVDGQIERGGISSYLSGLTVLIDWTQTSASGNPDSTRRIVKLKANGYYVLGVEIAGYEIGTRINGTWNIDSDDINDYI